ncbi:SCP2 sterol-binding domain-containing protein [Plastoroseomonas hellenica]|uniref:SCP2 sterol-binding domain-containing protein n=1 Tax=Plastoroseomonas hellenica TaxID=2687306 RepID=UPI001BA59B1B|nr:SCP2 sterol-binding domain-containing protein [Plastoroseomonas hellenica]MBR0643208.1 SCP2 sterol-binding domain-containing protein [Plastoroseomonas hellenica]
MTDPEAILDAVRAVLPKLGGLGYRVRFDVADTGLSFLLDGTGAAATVAEVDGEEPADTVLRMDQGNLTKLMEGRLSPMLAFATGKLKVEGSKGVALKLAGLLDED